ncbi:MAG TPA: hypothetical protein VFD13_05795 [Candidatus Kapabacteria bacterium]|nr:hypothetical protein [Candidatus Kapabacteria bacterium]
MRRRIAIGFLLALAFSGQAAAQQSGGGIISPVPRVQPLFDTMTMMPYVTGSLNLFSGKAFIANATGPGVGGGLMFDLTKEGQKTGFMFDFAFQDMYGVAQNGSCVNISGDTVLESANAYHYWQYLLFEPFLKLQTPGKQKGYFMLGASFGFAVLSETVSIGQDLTQFARWDQSRYGSRFRLDLRAGVGEQLGKIGGHALILELRAGYPVTNAISNYANVCTGAELGNWRIITLQANLGLKL